MAVIESIQIGKIITEGDPDSRDVETKRWTSAFGKLPVDSAVTVRRLGILGDEVADTVHHGGPDKAILCYAARHYDAWSVEHPELEFAPGGFGENLTISGLAEDDVCIGDRWSSNECEFEISQPRQPCWKIGRRWQTKSMTKEVAQTGRTGWYLRVVSPGSLAVRESFQLRERPNPNWSVRRANDILYGRETDPSARAELIGLSALSAEWKESLS